MKFRRNSKLRLPEKCISERCSFSQRAAILLTSVLFVASGLSTSTLAEAKEKISSFTNDSLSSFTADVAHNVGTAVSAAANTAGNAITSAASTIADSASSYFAASVDDLGTLRGGGGVYLF